MTCSCRYRPLLDAAKSFSSDKHSLDEACSASVESLASRPGLCHPLLSVLSHLALRLLRCVCELFSESGSPLGAGCHGSVITSTSHKLATYDGESHDRDFPAEKVVVREGVPKTPLSCSLLSTDPEAAMYAPTTVRELINLRAAWPKARLFHGNLDSVYEARKKHNIWLLTTRIKELSLMEQTPSGLKIGAGALNTVKGGPMYAYFSVQGS